MTAAWPVTDGSFSLGDLDVELGGTIQDAQLTWQAHGTLNDARDNVIVYPCRVLDPTEWFIIVPDMFSNGFSSSPSNTDDYPAAITMADNVRAQYRLLTEFFGVTRVAASYGFSMGGGQAYHWAALFPDAVERIAVVCGAARCAPHNQVFIEGVKHALMADAA